MTSLPGRATSTAISQTTSLVSSENLIHNCLINKWYSSKFNAADCTQFDFNLFIYSSVNICSLDFQIIKWLGVLSSGQERPLISIVKLFSSAYNCMQIPSQKHFAKSNCNYQVKNQDMYSFREFRHHFILRRLSHLLPNSRVFDQEP